MKRLVVATCAILLCGGARAAVEYGLATNYPGDAGISNDARVVFAENFEETSLADMVARWEYATKTNRMSLSADTPAVSTGARSLYVDATEGGADLYRRLLPGYQQLYLRFYAKFAESGTTIHHWVWLGGHNPSTAWPWPRAGLQPVGDERWSTGVEPIPSALGGWGWDFYTYWMHMRLDRDGNYWGNFFNRTPGYGGYSSPHAVTKGVWLCVEFMVKLNDPVTAYNGEQAFWIDGEKKSHLGLGFPNGTWDHGGFAPEPGGSPFEGFQWRSDTNLTINYLWLEHYVDSDHSAHGWFDDVVVATEYIGPAVSAGGDTDQPAQPAGLRVVP
ncbi:MAG: hypothetical protein JXR37_36255 [Kiritimatiellae bacterium]|nr:hypothetical protein [Kiritimatiellia bacterium]